MPLQSRYHQRLIDSFSSPASPFHPSKLSPPDVESEALLNGKEDGHSNGHSRKRRKIETDNSSPSPLKIEKVEEYPAAVLVVLEAFELIHNELEDLATLAQDLKLSWVLKSCREDDASMESEGSIEEFGRAVDSAQSMMDSQLRYLSSRAAWSSALVQSPEVQEYVFAIHKLDESALRTCRKQLVDIRNIYFYLLEEISPKQADKS
ncbi:hypothetical protein T439DRAFT_377910 [Meredithblackwellia eburnea MCA 4105]